MVGTALARMAAATPIVSACFDADARVLKPVIGWFSCSLFARLEVPSAAAGCNGPKLGRLDWLAEVQAALSLELHRNSGCRPCAADNGHRLDDGRNGEWRPVTAPAASLGLGTLRPDSLSSAANTVGVGIRRAVHPCLLRLRLSVHGAAWALATNASERGDKSLCGIGKHDKVSFCCNNGRVIPSSAVGHMVHPRKIQCEAAHTRE